MILSGKGSCDCLIPLLPEPSLANHQVPCAFLDPVPGRQDWSPLLFSCPGRLWLGLETAALRVPWGSVRRPKVSSKNGASQGSFPMNRVETKPKLFPVLQ